MKTLLFITHIHDLSNPNSGGAIRTSNLLRQLSVRYRVYIFCPRLTRTSDTIDVLNITPWWLHYFSKLTQTRGFTTILNQLERISLKIIRSSFKSFETLCIQQHINTGYDIVIFDTSHQYKTGLLKNNRSKFWLSAHNVDSELDTKNFKLRSKEKKLGKFFDGVIACTHSDVRRLKALSLANAQARYLVWENGTQEIDLPSDLKKPEFDLIFVGSLGYVPNEQGLRWFCDEILPKLIEAMPSIRCKIIGKRGDKKFEEYLVKQKSVHLAVNVPSVSPFYFNSKIAIVPLLSGSGSRLKIPEALVHGCPVVSTKIGAEGVASKTNGLYLADTTDQFADTITNLLREDICRNTIKNGTDRYKWNQTLKTHELDA